MLEARKVVKRYGGATILDGLDLTVKPGEVVGLVGMNGSGKTTLLDVLSGKSAADSGSVLVDGRPIDSNFWRRDDRPMFRTYQVPRLFHNLTLRQNMQLGHYAAPPSPDCGGVDGCHDTHFQLTGGQLSVGQRQRVILDWVEARIGRVKYLLLDEPSSGADNALVERLEHLLRRARDAGCGVLLIEHRDSMLDRMCTRVLHLREGRCQSSQPIDRASTISPGPVAATPTRLQMLIDDATLRRGCTTIVNQINLQAASGDVVALTGANGCGKSTLLRAISGAPECFLAGGRFMLNSDNMAELGLKARILRGIHLMPQDGGLFGSMSVRDFLRASVDASGLETWDNDRAQSLRQRIAPLDRIWLRKCGVLSGGERRFAALARMFLTRPKVALLDEPLAGIDRAGRPLVADLIAELARDGAIVLVAEQRGLLDCLPASRVLTLCHGEEQCH